MCPITQAADTRMTKPIGGPKVAHAHSKLGFQPSRFRPVKASDGTGRGGKPVSLRRELPRRSLAKGHEGHSSILEPAIAFACDVGKEAAVTVPLESDQGELALGDVLRLAPSPLRAGAIGA